MTVLINIPEERFADIQRIASVQVERRVPSVEQIIANGTPTIEPERKKGRWIRHPEQKNIFGGKTIECSECGDKCVVQYIENEKFCRNCGAKMGDPEDIPMEYFENGGR